MRLVQGNLRSWEANIKDISENVNNLVIQDHN